MPILYVHGVGIREGKQGDWDEMRTLLKGVDWASVQAHLRQCVAPVIQPSRPEAVVIQEAYWGDLGAAPLLPKVPELDSVPAALTPAALAEELEGLTTRFAQNCTLRKIIALGQQFPA